LKSMIAKVVQETSAKTKFKWIRNVLIAKRFSSTRGT